MIICSWCWEHGHTMDECADKIRRGMPRCEINLRELAPGEAPMVLGLLLAEACAIGFEDARTGKRKRQLGRELLGMMGATKILQGHVKPIAAAYRFGRWQWEAVR